jgi:hypothetical protein
MGSRVKNMVSRVLRDSVKPQFQIVKLTYDFFLFSIFACTT